MEPPIPPSKPPKREGQGPMPPPAPPSARPPLARPPVRPAPVEPPKPSAPPMVPSARSSEPSPRDIEILNDRLAAMERQAGQLIKQSQMQQNQKSDLEGKVDELQKSLAEEKQKAMLASVRVQEEKTLSMRVEANLRDIQEKLRRDHRERELELSRSKLENQIKEMERKLAVEREAWMEALKAQGAKREVEDKAIEERMGGKLRDIENRYAQERTRMAGKLEEKNREIEDHKRQMLLKEEGLIKQQETAQAGWLQQKHVLETKLKEMQEAFSEARVDLRELKSVEAENAKLSAQTDTQREKLQLAEAWQRESARLEGELQQSKAAIQQMTRRLTLYKERELAWEERLRSSQVWEHESKRLEALLAQSKQQQEALAAQISTMKDKEVRYAEVAARLRAFEAETKRLERDFERATAEAAKWRQEAAAANDSLQKAKMSLTSAWRMREQMEREHGQLEALKQRTQGMESAMTQLQLQKQGLLEASRRKIGEMEQESKSKASRLEAEKAHLEQALKDSQFKESHQQQELYDLRSKNQRLVQEAADLHSDLRHWRQEADSKTAASTQLPYLLEQNSQLKRETEAKSIENKDLAQEMNRTKMALSEIAAQRDTLDSKLTESKTQQAWLRQQFDEQQQKWVRFEEELHIAKEALRDEAVRRSEEKEGIGRSFENQRQKTRAVLTQALVDFGGVLRQELEVIADDSRKMRKELVRASGGAVAGEEIGKQLKAEYDKQLESAVAERFQALERLRNQYEEALSRAQHSHQEDMARLQGLVEDQSRQYREKMERLSKDHADDLERLRKSLDSEVKRPQEQAVVAPQANEPDLIHKEIVAMTAKFHTEIDRSKARELQLKDEIDVLKRRQATGFFRFIDWLNKPLIGQR
ncbi:MAG: hypothetical protein AABZ44_10745 [Elusimicrobiota bacterium]